MARDHKGYLVAGFSSDFAVVAEALHDWLRARRDHQRLSGQDAVLHQQQTALGQMSAMVAAEKRLADAAEDYFRAHPL